MLPSFRPTVFSHGLLLAFLLSCVPVFILFTETRAERERLAQDSRQVFQERLQRLGEHIAKQTAPEFWLERINHSLKKRLYESGTRFHDVAHLSRAMAKALQGSQPCGVPVPRIWGFFPPATSGERPQQCSGLRFEKEYQHFFARLFLEQARGQSESHSVNRVLAGGRWTGQLKAMFGDSISPELFSRAYRGKAFPVLFGGRQYLFLWDFLIRNRRIQGGYYLLLPFEHDQHVKTLEWCLDNWATGPEYPCFLPLNSALGNFPSPALVHSRLLHPEVRAHISLLQQQMFHAGPLFQQMIPFVQLLAPLLGKTLEFGQTRRWRAQLFPVSPLSHHAGLLVVPLNELPPGPLERVSWGITVSWAFGWLLLLIFVFLKDRLPELRVQAQLSLWFLGLIAIPLALSMGSSARLIGDMRSNREDSLKSELRHALQEIELGSTRLGNSYYTEIQRMTVTSTFADELFEAHGHPEKKAAFRDHHWEAMKQRKLPVQGFLIYGHRNFLLSRFDPDVHPDMQNWIQVTLQTIWNRYSQTASPSARFAAIPHLPPSKATGAFADRSFLRFSDGRWFQPGFDPLVIGNRNLILARRFLPIDGLPGYVLIFLWTPEPLFTPYLQKTLARDHFLEDGLPLFRAGFSSRGQGLWDVSSGQNETGFHVPLRSMAEQARFQPIWKKDERRQLLAYAYPSSVLPGYILAGAASLRGIDREIQQELLRLLGLFSGLTVFALALAHLLSRRFSQPVIRMTQGLRAIAQGNLETRIAEFRGDELGVCGRILDNMTQWLRERRTMSRFVSPQVLDLIGEGDYQTAMAGVARRVTILVSDIRNFTTLSETHPPEAIFRMVNRHMEIMTQAIQKHGGAIDRFIGDAVVAVFYADGQAPTYVRGLRAAAAMRLGHEQLQRERSRDGSFSYEIGIGLAEGQVIAGVTGDPNSRLDFSVMGEPLQKAGDYEASSKAGRFSKIIVPEKMKQKISGRFIFSALPGNPGLFELVELEEKHPQTARGNESGSPVALPSALPTNSSLPAQPASESPAALLFGMWSGAGLSRGFWAFLIVWILFPLLLLIPGHTWRERVVTQQRDAGRAKIREQVQIFQNTFDPQSQTEQFLNNSLTRLHRQTGNNRRKLFAAVRTFLPTFRRYFPGMQAYYALHEASGDASRDLPKYGETLTRIFHNGNPGAAPLPRQDVHTFFQVFKTQILYPHIDFPKIHEDVFAHAGIEWKQKQFLPAFGIQNTTDFSRILTHAQGRLFLVNSAQGASYFFWLPFWQEKTWGQADRKPVYLQGMLLLWIPAAELRQDILPELCVRNQKEEGFECSITYQTGSEKRRISTRAFHPDQPLRQVSLPGSATIFNHSDWILAHFNVALEGTYRMIFARRQAAPPGFPGISRLLPLALVWAFFGLLAGCFRHAISTRIDVGIRRQMLGTFVIFLLPGLLAGGVLFRESLLEQYARLVADQQKTLSRELSGLDQGNLLYQGFACGLLDRHTRKREFIERLGSSPESSRPHVELRNDQILLDLYKVVYYLGVQIKSMWVIGLDGPARGLRSDKDLIAVTRNAIQPTLEALDPERGGGKRSPDLEIGSSGG
jgi:class 3 adenylate cyclase